MNNILNNIPKQYLMIGGGVLILLLVAGTFMSARGRSNSQAEVPAKTVDQTDEVIPTVDSSVKVAVKALENRTKLLLTVDGMPKGTEALEYELSYETKEQGLQGAIGVIDKEVKGKDSIEKEILLGTCSSGRCVYHDVVGKVNVKLKFTGSYGEKIFEKDFELEERT